MAEGGERRKGVHGVMGGRKMGEGKVREFVLNLEYFTNIRWEMQKCSNHPTLFAEP